VNGTINRPSPKFVETLKTMIAELAAMSEYGAAQAAVARTVMNEEWTAGRFDQAAAKRAFEAIKRQKGLAREAMATVARQQGELTKAPRTALPEVPKGRYALPSNTDDPEKIRFFQVDVNGTYYHVYVQAGPELHEMRYKAFRAVLQEIVDFGVLESLVLYGKTLKVCGRCGIPLTHPDSRAAGIGPICAEKAGS
jgi:hypothetical protein